MPLTNERFDEYLEDNVKRANLMSLSKEIERNHMFSSMNRRAWLWINQRSSISLINPSLDDDSDDDICQLKCKHCSFPKRFDNADMAAIVMTKGRCQGYSLLTNLIARARARIGLRTRTAIMMVNVNHFSFVPPRKRRPKSDRW
jgi:hypothetical protein